MQELSHDMFSLLALAFVFGVKHGLDPDHLATIDGLARFNASSKPWLAQWAGVLFSIGHGVVVTAVAGFIAIMPGQISVPGWLEGLGSTVSILTLLVLGVLNLYAAFNRHNVTASAIGLKRWMRIESGHPAMVLGIGALFALSFDTMSLAAFFSLSATHVSGEMYAVILGVIFTSGMIVSDGVNGMLTARFIKQSSERALIAARVMSFTIGSMSLCMAFIGIARWLQPAFSEQIGHLGIWAGVAVLVWVAAGFILSIYVTRVAVLKLENSKICVAGKSLPG